MPVTKLEEPKAGPFLHSLWRYVVRAIRRINRGYDAKMKPFHGQVLIDESETTVTLDFTKVKWLTEADADNPLKLIAANDGAAKGSIVYGTVAGFDIAPAATAVSNNDNGYVDLTVSYNTTTGVWTASAAALAFAATVPAATATHAYLNLGYFTVSGVIAVAFPALSGSQSWKRCGNSSTYVDNWYLQ